MTQPAQLTPAKALRALMRERRAPTNTILPGSSLRCAVRLLSDREIDEARLAAVVALEERAKKSGTSLESVAFVDPELFDRMKTRRILAAAFVQPVEDPDAEPAQLFPSASPLEDLDAVLVSEMFEAYLDLQDARTTRVDLPDEEVERIAAALGTDHADELLSAFDIGTLRRLVRALARRLRPQPKGE